MNVHDALINRYSCRSFLDKEVSRDVLEKILADAFRAPSCENSQPWQVFVAGQKTMDLLRKRYDECREAKVAMDLDQRFDGNWTKEMRARIDSYFDGILEHEPKKNLDYTMQKRNLFYAPAMVFICIDSELPTWSVFDTGLFAQSLMLSATEYGLATIASAVSVAYPQVLREVLEIPDNYRIIIGIGIGYPDTEQKINSFRTDRKDIREVRFFL